MDTLVIEDAAEAAVTDVAMVHLEDEAEEFEEEDFPVAGAAARGLFPACLVIEMIC